MDFSRRKFIGKTSGLLGVAYIDPALALAETFVIQGEVLRKDDTPVDSVLISAYRDKVKISETTSMAGKYSLSFEKGNPIDTLRYERTEYIVDVVNDLCGTRSHNINKVMYLRGTKLQLFESLQLLSSLERVFYIETANNRPIGQLRNTYGPILTEMNQMFPETTVNLSEKLRGRFREVMSLYAMGLA
jgi:hypothetical protein